MNGWYLLIAGVVLILGVVVVLYGRHRRPRNDGKPRAMPDSVKILLIALSIAAVGYAIVWLVTEPGMLG